MFMIKITDDKDNVNSCNLLNYNVSVSGEVLILELNTNTGLLKYEIHSDQRESDISLIEDFIKQELEAASLGQKSFVLSEYLVRAYIYIGEDANRRQFTAHKIK